MKKLGLLSILCLIASMATAQVIWTMAGTPNTSGNAGDGGLATAATLTSPSGITADGSGNVYVVDVSNHRVRKISPTGVITAFAGTGTSGFSGDGGQATAAKLNNPVGVAIDASGNVYITDLFNYRIRKVNTSGVISTIAGTGTLGTSGDGGAATSALLNEPAHLTIEYSSGDLYFSDGESRVRKIAAATGTITAVAGTTTLGFSGNGGAATSANMNGVEGICLDANYIYITESVNLIVRKVDRSTGIITAFAGTQGSSGYTGDGGAATSATFGVPREIKVDGSGNFFISDQGNQVIRKINSSGTISSYTSPGSYSGEGVVPGSASIDYPAGIFIHSSGDMYITDQGSYSVRKISANCPALAGPNKHNQNTVCCGCTASSVAIGTPSVTNMTYSWTPNTNLSSTSAAQPNSTWCSTAGTAKIYTVTVTNANCTSNTSTVSVITDPYSPSGNNSCCRIGHFPDEDITMPSNFKAYPNPTNAQISISLYSSSDEVKIIDVTGRVVYEMEKVDAGEVTIDVSKYNRGIYFIIVKMGGKNEKQKIIIE